jgi:hypothetical protein
MNENPDTLSYRGIHKTTMENLFQRQDAGNFITIRFHLRNDLKDIKC